MRKFLAVLLAASVLTPGVAWADNHNDRPERVRDRGDDGERSERRAERRTERATERPQRVERERSERPAPGGFEARRGDGDNGVRRIGRGDRRERPVIEQRVVDQAPSRPAPVVRAREGSLLGGMIDRAEAHRDGERVRDAERVRVGDRRDGDRRDGNWREGRGDWQSNDRVRERDGSQWRDRDGDRRWSSHWRSDRRYDWRNYRDRNRSIFRIGRYYDPYRYGYRRFSIGFSLWPNYYQSNYWIDDPWMYRLPPAYGPYRWVRYYDDALLVNIYSGEVVDVIHSFFWSRNGW
jgi:hypothetical protein